MTIYLDVIWLLNFLFDSLLLLLTAIILKRTFSLWRLLAGGFVGSLIILLSITPFHAYSGHTLIKLSFSVLMVFISFGYHRFYFFMKSLVTLYFVTFLMGGAIIGVHYFLTFDMNLSSSVIISSIKGYGDPISWMFVLLGFPIAWHFSKTRIEGIEMTHIQFDQLVKVTIKIHETSYQFTGLIDSGNQLYDPLSRTPVMIVSIAHKLADFPPSFIQLTKAEELLANETVELPKEFANKIRLIPYRVVGQEQQILIAVKPDQVILEKEGNVFAVEKVLVSFTVQQLSPENQYQCIVHPKMLTEKKIAVNG